MHRKNPRSRQDTARKTQRIRPRLCIQSLPTNNSFLALNMPRSNASCTSCMCCDTADEPTPCCASAKCEINIQRQQKNQTCCNEPEEEYDLNCPICREAMKKAAQPACKVCEDNAKNESNLCSICKDQMEKQDNKCPSCKKKEATKKVEKELRCPSCAQPVQLQCCMPEGIPSISIILVPDKLFKENSTNTKCCEESDEEEPCCKPSKSSVKKKESCCKMAEKPSKSSCPDDCANMKRLERPSSGQSQIKRQPEKRQSAIKTEDLNKGREGKPGQPATKASEDVKRTKSSAQCSEECAAARGNDNCSCIFPPAFKQYSCTGQIGGVCDCTKKDE